MVSKKKCSSYASELSTKHTTRAAVGLNACRWERRTEDTPDYDVVTPPSRKIPRAPPKARKLSDAGKKRVAKSKEMEFMQAPRKVQPKPKSKPKSKPLPANLREGLTAQQRKRLQSYTGQRGNRLKWWRWSQNGMKKWRTSHWTLVIHKKRWRLLILITLCFLE